MRDASNGEIARDAQAIGRDALYPSAGEGDLREAVDGEIVRAQVGVAAVITGRDAGGLNVRGDAGGFRLGGIVVQIDGPLAERSIDPGDAEVPHAKCDRAVRGIG